MKVVILSFPLSSFFPLEFETLFSSGFIFRPPKNNSCDQHYQKDNNWNPDNVSSPFLLQKKTPVDGFYNRKESVFLIINLQDFSGVRIDVSQFVNRKFVKIIPLVRLMLIPIELVRHFFIYRNVNPMDRILFFGLLVD